MLLSHYWDTVTMVRVMPLLLLLLLCLEAGLRLACLRAGQQGLLLLLLVLLVHSQGWMG
jgi:hypothetical protein